MVATYHDLNSKLRNTRILIDGFLRNRLELIHLSCWHRLWIVSAYHYFKVINMDTAEAITFRSIGGGVPTRLMLDGYSAIQYCTGNECPHSRFTEDMQLIFVKAGMLTIRHGNMDFSVGRDQMALMKKNISVEFRPIDESVMGRVEFVRFVIKEDMVKEFVKFTDLSLINRDEQLPVIVKEGRNDCLAYMGSLDAYLSETTRPEAGWVRVKVLELLFLLANMGKHILEQLLDIRDHYRTNITSVVESNVTNSKSLEQLAAMSGRSLSSFRRDFMSIYNMPPSQWIRLKRLEKAKELVLGTTMTITDICYTLGFESIAHFSRLFKSHYGCPPSDYR
jgi:AraC family transcriptional regulator, exoenzyme S synthesis regulatory protein ExsA